MDAKFIEKVYKDSKVNPTPEIRNLLLKIAEYFYSNKQYSESIFFHLKSHCLSFETRNFFKSPKLETLQISPVTTWTDILPAYNNNNQTDEVFDSLLNFAANESEFQDILHELQMDPAPETTLNIYDELEKIGNFCSNELPREWTILQITKNYDSTLTTSINEEFLYSVQPIYIVILKHLRSHEYPELISVKINLSKELYKKVFDIRKNFKQTFSFQSEITDEYEDVEKQKQFHYNLLRFNDEISLTIGLLIEELGPWAKLFSSSSIRSEKTLKNLKKIDEFCDNNNLENRTRILLSLLLVDGKNFFLNNIKKLMHMLNPNENATLEKNLIEFCQNEVFEYNKHSGNPCLLIIDEMLDHFPWEMVKPDEEFYRLSSFDIMSKLYEKYKPKIFNGYIQLSIINANALINPENNLDLMETRMLKIIKYYFPKWNIINSKIPNSDDLMNLITSEDVFIYCGHGGCIRFIQSNIYLKSLSKSVIFLFGCESTKLKSSSGLHSELRSEHLYFHSGLCPAVIGCNHVAFDFQLDLMSITLLTKWIKHDSENISFSNLDKKQWKKGNLKFLSDNENVAKMQTKLGKILSELRCYSESTANKITLVYRGLPVVNTNVK